MAVIVEDVDMKLQIEIWILSVYTCSRKLH
jgi:hypothetical protein